MLAKAPVWHFWIAVFLTFPAVLLVLATVIGYLVKVVAPKYQRES